MNATIKSPDRINVTKKAREIINAIDEKQYLGLGSPTPRMELFMFAMALGIETVPTKLDNINPGGLVLDTAIDGQSKSLMYAYFISRLPSVDLIDNATNKEYVYNMAQEYSNTGFQILDDYMENKKDTTLIWDLLAELDKQYFEYIK